MLISSYFFLYFCIMILGFWLFFKIIVFIHDLFFFIFLLLSFLFHLLKNLLWFFSKNHTIIFTELVGIVVYLTHFILHLYLFLYQIWCDFIALHSIFKVYVPAKIWITLNNHFLIIDCNHVMEKRHLIKHQLFLNLIFGNFYKAFFVP